MAKEPTICVRVKDLTGQVGSGLDPSAPAGTR